MSDTAGLSPSFGQEQLWFVDRFHSDLPMMHNVPLTVRLRGPLDAKALGRALDALVARHDALRTRLVSGADGRPLQVVDAPSGAPLIEADLSASADPEEGLRALAAEESAKPFDLAEGPLFRAHLVRLADGEHALFAVAHSVVFDRGSAGVLVRDLTALYGAEVTGGSSGLAEPPMRFSEYGRHERELLQGGVLADLAGYWRERLDGFPNLQMPTDRPRPLVADHVGGVERLNLGAQVLDGLRALGEREGATTHATLLAALQTLMQRYTGQDDIVTGVASPNRDRPERAPLIGALASTLPVRTDLSGDPVFTELLAQVHATTDAAYAHQDLPFAKMVEELRVERDTGRPPVYQVALTLTEEAEEHTAADVSARLDRIDLVANRVDLDFFAEVRSGELHVELSYATALFDAGTARRLLGNLQVLLNGVAEDSSRRLSELPVLSAAEMARELVEWNDTAVEFPQMCIHERFELQVEQTPDGVAAELGDETVTYAELNADANRIARHLRDLGVGQETLVGVSMAPSPRRLSVLLGIMKAGGGYVPLDPALPGDRLSFMIEDTAMPVIVAEDATEPGLPETDARMVRLDQEWERISTLEDGDPGFEVKNSNLAYVIYTSGSTGRPKGVMVEHRHAFNFIIGMIGHWRIGPEDRVLQFASLNFDVSVMDMFMTLLSGARAVLARSDVLLSPGRLADLMRDRGVTFSCLPPAVVNLLSGQDFPDLRIVLSAGEELSGELVRKWLRPGLEFYNGYGPTEAAIGSTFSKIDGTTFPPPIGRPKPNYQAYVLDRHLNPVPVGVAGELHVGGAGVTRGYLNSPELTEQRFIPDPFRPGGRLYKTGDLVRRNPDGTLVFLGRIDGQVKIRGLRVELGEIETSLVSHPAVAQAVVVVAADRSGEKQLTGYVRFDPDLPQVSVADLRQHLAQRLPAYMVPTYLQVLEVFPLTTNGKIDKTALPAPDAAVEAAKYVAPRTLVETVLADTYARLLGHERVGIDDGFFDLGGNSLQAMQLITGLRDDLAVDLNVASVFLAPTPRQLTVLLCEEHGIEDAGLGEELQRGSGETQTGVVRRAAETKVLPLSFGQEQMWFIDRFAPGLPTYNIPNAVRLDGPLDGAALHRALDGLVARHEALRTRLVADADGRPYQAIDEPAGAAIVDVDLAGLAPAERETRLRALCAEEAARPFSLSAGPLFRTHLVRLAPEEHALVVVVHHAVFDGWSVGVMLRELGALYEAEVTGDPSGLAELPVQFADYAIWERERLSGPPADLIAYWQETLKDFPTLQMPTDRPRPRLDSFDGGVEWLNMGREVLDGLKALSRREGTTLYVTMLAALQALLQRYTGQDDIVVGTVSANRDRAELEPLIGFLVNTLAIRTDLSGDPTFAELLRRVRDVTVGAYAHQDVPFAKLVEELRVERDPGRAPVFQVGMTLAEPVEAVAAADVTMRIEKIDLLVSKFDLSFLAESRAGELWVELSYATALFDVETVRRMLGHLRVLLDGAAKDPSRRLSELPVLSAAEMARELVEWNDTAVEFPRMCIHEGFEQQAERTPDGVAAELDGETVTYAELNADANRIARHLRDLGVGRDVLVGVSMAPSPRRLSVLLGIMKAGGGYVPLDPALPGDRLSFMIEDTAMPVIVAEDATEASLPDTGARLVSVDRQRDEISALDGANPGFEVKDADLAYVIYTSGSTGRPKGVMVEHRHAFNFLVGMIGHWKIGPEDRVLQFASLNFDVSVMDMFMTLLSGARAVLATKDTLSSPPRLAGLMRDSAVTFSCLPPAVVNLLSGQEFPDLRIVLSAGEELSGELVRKWLRPGLEFYNGYGPTEAAIGATFSRIDGTMFPPPIGRPKPNYQAYVLDAHLNPVPVGVAGELHVGGAGVTRGYLNSPELTEQRFIPDPFRPGGRLYKTGDLVRRMPDGNLVFLGRIDGQVKIRGLRVELGEIETGLVSHPSVAQAVVVVAEDRSGERQLTGYVRFDPDVPEVSVADLRQHLAQRMPAYMVPTYLLKVAEFPLNTNGKIDKGALPAPDSAAETTAYVAPRTVIETVLADMYGRLLGLDRVGIDDGFFDLGGNSLQAMQLITGLRDDLAVDLNLASIFLAHTPRQLTELLLAEHGLEDADLGADELAGLGDGHLMTPSE